MDLIKDTIKEEEVYNLESITLGLNQLIYYKTGKLAPIIDFGDDYIIKIDKKQKQEQEQQQVEEQEQEQEQEQQQVEEQEQQEEDDDVVVTEKIKNNEKEIERLKQLNKILRQEQQQQQIEIIEIDDEEENEEYYTEISKNIDMLLDKLKFPSNEEMIKFLKEVREEKNSLKQILMIMNKITQQQ